MVAGMQNGVNNIEQKAKVDWNNYFFSFGYIEHFILFLL